MAASKKAHFSKTPILKFFLRKFLRFVLGLVGLNDAKGINVAQRIWPWGGPTKAQKQPKSTENAFFENWRFWKMSFFWVGHFEFFFRKKKNFFCFIPMKISPNLYGRMDGSKFWCFPWFPENSLLCVILCYTVYVL